MAWYSLEMFFLVVHIGFQSVIENFFNLSQSVIRLKKNWQLRLVTCGWIDGPCPLQPIRVHLGHSKKPG
uniref:Ion transport domain-containing protein n=1 Tax=Anguilla anguilla TaxID=7936 RepID=A0A0E9WYG7_ANGAN